MYSAKIVLDSINPIAIRLTALEVSLPRIVLAELNTHKRFTRNSASSRAIPVEKMLTRVMEDPFIPTYWGKKQSGMQAVEELSPEDKKLALHYWLQALDNAVESAKELLSVGLHKQITNRLLEPFLWHTVLITSTHWRNFLALRPDKAAQPEIQVAAEYMLAAYKTSSPQELRMGEYYLPLVSADERLAEPTLDWRMVSVGRCARVSYLTHNGIRDPQEDLRLSGSLLKNGHMSPFEHVARAVVNVTYDSRVTSILRGYSTARRFQVRMYSNILTQT